MQMHMQKDRLASYCALIRNFTPIKHRENALIWDYTSIKHMEKYRKSTIFSLTYYRFRTESPPGLLAFHDLK